MALISIAGGHRTHAASYSEVALKAAYLHRFAAYVEWPSTVEPGSVFLIGVVGPGSVIDEMRRTTGALFVEDRRVVIRSVQDPADLDDLRILYIAPGHLANSRNLVSSVRTPMLIVTDEPYGLTRGGVVNFVRVGPNVRFEASVIAAEQRGLRLRSGLLSIAIRVVSQPVSRCCNTRARPYIWIAAAQQPMTRRE